MGRRVIALTSITLLLALASVAGARMNPVMLGGTQEGSAAPVDDEFEIAGATYFAVAPPGYSYSTTQTTNYSTRKYNTLSSAVSSLSGSPTTPQVINIIGTWTSADSSAVSTGHSTTSSDNYILIRTVDSTGARHKGTFSTSYYRLAATDTQYGIDLKEAFVRVDGLQIDLTLTSNSTTPGILIEPVADNGFFRFSNCIIRTGSGQNYQTGSGISASNWSATTYTAEAYNNIIYGFNRPGFSASGILTMFAGVTLYASNNTIYENDIGLYNTSGTIVAKNNIVYGSGDTLAYVGTFAAGTDYNLTDGTDNIGTGDNNQVTSAVSFVSTTAGSEDLHLASALGYGTSLASYGHPNITTDIDGKTRSGAWDNGADQYGN